MKLTSYDKVILIFTLITMNTLDISYCYSNSTSNLKNLKIRNISNSSNNKNNSDDKYCCIYIIYNKIENSNLSITSNSSKENISISDYKAHRISAHHMSRSKCSSLKQNEVSDSFMLIDFIKSNKNYITNKNDKQKCDNTNNIISSDTNFKRKLFNCFNNKDYLTCNQEVEKVNSIIRRKYY